MNLGTATVLRADARQLPIADNSIDLVVTSPPYFALRSYQDGGEHYAGQIGDEPTPDEFVDSLLDVTRECIRVLKPAGSLWVNLGDKYSTYAGNRSSGRTTLQGATDRGRPVVARKAGLDGGGQVRAKSLMGIPWRYALRCIDDLDLVLRSEVIWSKPNGLPESVTDRVRRSHEQWFQFEQSGSEVVEPGAQGLPLCPLCGRPADARASLVARLHEVDPGVEHGGLPDKERADQRVKGEGATGADEPGMVRPRGSAVPLAVPVDGHPVQDPADLLHDGGVAVVDENAEVGTSGTAVAEGNAPLAVDDAGEPSEVCRCSHPFILNDQPWIPQTLAAELMQMVADGEADAQHVADFLSGDFARTHSTWFHFTLNPRYFSGVDEIREAHAPQSIARSGRAYNAGDQFSVGQPNTLNPEQFVNPLGKLPGSVWTVPTEPLTVPADLGVDHFAAFPTEWPKRIIQGWSPTGVCTLCGEGRRPVSERGPRVDRRPSTHKEYVAHHAGHETRTLDVVPDYRIAGYACACPDTTAPTTPGRVLDPFGGTGTVAMVAKALGRDGISVDMSSDYCRIGQWRTNDRNQLGKVLGVEKAPAVDVDQLGLFE